MRNKMLLFFMLPSLLIYGVFSFWPTLNTFFYSFTDWDGLTSDYSFVGFDHYTRLIGSDSIFHTAITNNIKFMLVVVIFQTLFSLILSLFLIKNSPVNVGLRALFFFPTILSSVSVAFIWAYMYDPSLGLLNQLFDSIGLGSFKQNWIGDQNIAIYSISITQVWFHTGQMIVLFVAGLHAIPKDLYEVARIEGASRWQSFRFVTWPLLAPATTIVIAFTTVQTFKAFDLIYAMTRGGPNYSTEILATFIYTRAFRSYEFGYASAAAVLLMAISALIAFLQFRLLRTERS